MIVVVGGAHSGIGKTELICRLIERLENVCTVKCVVSGDQPGVRLVLSGSELEKEGKDTARYTTAGAARVIMVRAGRRELARVTPMLQEIAAQYRYMLIEGNSIVTHVNADHVIFLDDGAEDETRGSRITREVSTMRLEAFHYDLEDVIDTLVTT